MSSPPKPPQDGAKSSGNSGRPSTSSDDTVSGPFDFEKSLREMQSRKDQSGIQRRELGVLFKDLRVLGAASGSTYQWTFGSLFVPGRILEAIQQFRRPHLRHILNGFEGVVRSGEMLLVLGNPGSGCSTFLKTLVNQRHEYHAVEGEVCYDSFTADELAKHYRGDLQYCPEDDDHFATLTVDQTISFAASMRIPENRPDNISRSEYIREMTNTLESTFGLQHVRNTVVGNAAIRGVSGGEKKRVSLSEMLSSRALIGAWDNSTRGLDSSTALEFISALRAVTDVNRLATIVSLYQAGESLYEKFDKVCVIYEGRMAYFGPANRARQYFIDLGFEPKSRQTTSDYLAAVTNPHARTPRPGFEQLVPRTAAEFADTFLESPLGKQNRADMESYRQEFVGNKERAQAYLQSAQAERSSLQLKASPYTVSMFTQAQGLMKRRAQILKGGWAQEAVQITVFIIQAVITGSIFYKLAETTSAFYSRGGVIFFSLLFASLAAQAEIPVLFQQRPIVLRHYKGALYHPWIEAVAMTIVDIPLSLASLGLFSIVLYFMVGFQRTAAQFFIFYLFIMIMTFTMKAYFRSITSAFKSPAPAQSTAGLIFLMLTFYTGYSLPKQTMIGALKWITFINPMIYGFEALMTNEFHTINGTCSTLVPSGPGYGQVPLSNQVCTTVGSVAGRSGVDGNRYLDLSFTFRHSHLWRDLGILFAFFAVFISALLIFTEINTISWHKTSALLFLRNKDTVANRGQDEEKGVEEKDGLQHTPSSPVAAHRVVTVNSVTAPKMTDIFTWRHLEYEVPVDKETRRLLDDISGFVVPGKLTALMGESGAGKTTLLNVLAQRTSTGTISGERLISGHPLPIDFEAQTGYCQQTDTHLPSATVREAVSFSARLRQPASIPEAEKEAYVEVVLKMCGLEAFGDAIVGSLGVEHKKRTTIAIELAAKPKFLLFLDEPTSGLDAQSAWGVVTFLRELAEQGLAILCTIHQPSSELFQQFDRMLLLQKGGKTVYFGDLGQNATKVISYFETNGGYPCPPDANPAEYMLDVIGAGATATTDIDWSSVWRQSPEAKQATEELENHIAQSRLRPPIVADHLTEYAASWFYQVKLLYIREIQRHWRDPVLISSKLFLNVSGGLFVGLTFLRTKHNIIGTQNLLFSLYMTVGFANIMGHQVQAPFLQTREIFEVRERMSRIYKWTALITSQLLAELPIDVFFSILYFLTWYWTNGFPSDRGGYSFAMIGIIFPLYYASMAQAVAGMTSNAQSAALLYSTLWSMTILFNGTLQPYAHLGWWKWMYRVSPYAHFIDGFLGQAVGHSEINCLGIEFVTVQPPSGQTCSQYLTEFISNSGGYISNPNATDSCQYCPARTTDQFLDAQFNVKFSDRWLSFGLLWVYIAFNIGFLYAVTYLRQPKKNKPKKKAT